MMMGMFYLYDTTSADRVLDPIEHRVLVAKVAKRSRYYIVNPGLIDRPEVRGNQLRLETGTSKVLQPETSFSVSDPETASSSTCLTGQTRSSSCRTTRRMRKRLFENSTGSRSG